MESLALSWFGTLFFLASAILIATSISYPTAVLIRNSRGDRVQCGVLLFTWLAPLIDLIVVVSSPSVALYPLFAFIMVAVVISNMVVLIKYRPPMTQSAWSFVGFILVLILLDGLFLWLGPVFPCIAQLLPYKGSIS